MRAQQKSKNRITYTFLIAALIVSVLFSMRYGAVDIGVGEMVSAIRKIASSADDMTLNERLFITIRMPRAMLCVLVGAALGAGGALMQALFRNPIVEPGLIGTSSGAAFGAAFYFVLGANLKLNTNSWSLPLAACVGAALSSALVFVLAISRQTGKISIITLLLTGMAVNALFMSGVGFLSYIARDPQARSITFWGLGNLSVANWQTIRVVAVSSLCCIVIATRYSNQLNTLMLGEDEAHLLGVNVVRLRMIVLSINIVMIAVATAFVGVISFVGLIVPHILRILKGSDNRFLIPGSALLGAILLSMADLVARMLLRPAELPIGIITSVVGVPVFVFLLRRKNYLF